MLARVIEKECIGCTKCIDACPFDAIIGSATLMHNVIPDLCTGCKLCVPACPVDCIEMVKVEPTRTSDERKTLAKEVRKRYHARQIRLQQAHDLATEKLKNESLQKRREYVKEAIKRVKEKASSSRTR